MLEQGCVCVTRDVCILLELPWGWAGLDQTVVQILLPGENHCSEDFGLTTASLPPLPHAPAQGFGVTDASAGLSQHQAGASDS